MDLLINNMDTDVCYKTFFRHNASIMLITDLETLNIVDANVAACNFYKYNYEEILKLKISDINIMAENQIIERMQRVVKSSEYHFNFKHRLSTGEIKSVSVYAGLVVFNGKNYLHSIIHDASESKDTIEEVSKLSSSIQIMLDNLPFNAWLKDINGKYTSVNKPFEEETCLSKEEIIGKKDSDIFTKELADMYRLNDQEVINRRKTSRFEEIYEGNRWREEYRSPVIDEYDNIIGTTGISRDITERKLMDKALRDAERKQMQTLEETIELKDNFITLITHEFKTPITIINAAVQTMEIMCKNELNSAMRKFLYKIKQNSLRQQRLVDNLLDVTKIKAGRMQLNISNINIVSLTKEIVESVKIFAQQKNLKISFHSTCEKKVIAIDMEKYERILLNLLSNAIKFSPPKKTIYVKLSFQEDLVRLEVIDKGIGIPSGKQGIIFEQFGQADSSFSRQAEGTGIGLYLVKLLVDELHGTIILKSKENCGASFTVLLPAANQVNHNQIEVSTDSIRRTTSLEFSDIIF